MKFKIAKPEDYPEIEDYIFKLSNAYATLYGDMITLLSYVDISIENLGGNPDKYTVESVVNILEKHIKQYKAE